jgi:integration host factor subunit beta
MLKPDLVRLIWYKNPHLRHSDVERIINAMFDSLADAMARGERVELRGFGAFAVRHRKARMGRNPRSGALVSVERKAHPYFRPGKEMRPRLNPDEPSS